MKLTHPRTKSKISIEETLFNRRSIRSFKNKPLSEKEISQILWAAYGVTEPEYGKRTAPSGGATYPIEIYTFTEDGVSLYLPETHILEEILRDDLRDSLAVAALGQSFIKFAGLDILIVGIFEKITSTYGDRGIQYLLQESGHIAQNIHLQSVALGIGSVAVGAFDTAKIQKLLQLPSKKKPVYIIPVGYPA